MAQVGQILGKRWEVRKKIGRGGQANVYEVADITGVPSPEDVALRIRDGVRYLSAVVQQQDPDPSKVRTFVDAMRQATLAPTAPQGALKELHPFETDDETSKTKERMRSELKALRAVKHPALILVLDDAIEEGWFVTTLFRSGTLETRLTKTRGRVLDTLVEIRPIVDAVAQLHRANIIHRDIKPGNIFQGDHGLVLGDLGLALSLDGQERLTSIFENVGTRDFQPAWTHGLRIEQVNPTFDTFSLGKLIWAMVAGRQKFPLWYFAEQPHDLRAMFPNDPAIVFVHRLLKDCVVEREASSVIRDGAAMLDRIDEAIYALRVNATPPSTVRPLRCRFCAVGGLQRFANRAEGDQTWVEYVCSECGHVERFLWQANLPPRGWERES